MTDWQNRTCTCERCEHRFAPWGYLGRVTDICRDCHAEAKREAAPDDYDDQDGGPSDDGSDYGPNLCPPCSSYYDREGLG